ncbi:hypothetical protein [Flavobacterium sp. HSC-61S13]|uniref:hypothetical protein n=1 Tax=Flavobacterium sp. HSC-61S13 TaxID=2910963 RepID=UPI0020A0048F|nr:hypothetical protein [Flavobacterium sp. HSC-61S13]MCP1994313.1 hypothetical protein [Flavobacterium sp. HSC-61S13]
MNPLFLIPVALLIAGVCFMIYMNKKHKAVKTEIDLDAERTRYDVYKKELLADDFSQLKTWMKDKPIEAFTTGSIPQSLANKIQEMATEGLKNVALSTVGLKLKNLETDCFWVLSGNDLHFFITNALGALEEHIVFDHFRIEEAKMQYAGVLKQHLGVYLKTSEEYLPQIHRLTFQIDGDTLSLEVHDRLSYVPDPTDILNLKKQFLTRAKYQVVGEKFVEIVQDKFPNLKIV